MSKSGWVASPEVIDRLLTEISHRIGQKSSVNLPYCDSSERILGKEGLEIIVRPRGIAVVKRHRPP